MANPNLGHIMCPLSGKWAVVRAQCNGRLYWFSDAGKITPALPMGQQFINDNAVMWEAPEKPPEHVTIRANYRGAPPIVNVEKPNEAPTGKALTDESEEKRENKPAARAREKRTAGIFDILKG